MIAGGVVFYLAWNADMRRGRGFGAGAILFGIGLVGFFKGIANNF